MRINYNASAMISNNMLANNDKALAKSLERLSSGLKINHGKDNPSGLAMVKRIKGARYAGRLSVNSLDITSENMTAAYSRIMDVDMAEEMTEYTTDQVLTQAGTSMLAQANERPAQVLQLLQ